MILLGTVSDYVGNFIFELNCFRFIYQTRFVITFIRTLMMKSICELYVICGIYVESCTILVVVNRLSRPVVVLDGLPGLYGLKYDSATACGLPLYLYSYKLVGSATSEWCTSRSFTFTTCSFTFYFTPWQSSLAYPQAFQLHIWDVP